MQWLTLYYRSSDLVFRKFYVPNILLWMAAEQPNQGQQEPVSNLTDQ